MRCCPTDAVTFGFAIFVLTACPGDSTSADEVGETFGSDSETGTTDTEDTGTDTETDTGELNCGELGSGGPPGPFADRESVEITLSESSCPVFAADPDTPEFGPFPVEFNFPVALGETIPPDGAYPLVIFQHGNSQFGTFYDYLWDAIVPQGLFVANLDTILASNLPSRMVWYRCAIEYFGDQWPDAQFLSDNPGWPVAAVLDSRLMLAGHSMSGEAALRVAAEIVTTPSLMHGLVLQGLITMVPREGGSLPYQFPSVLSVDYLGLSGSIDNDVPGGALRIHELAGDDQDSAADPGASKTLVWAYDVAHNAFGGVDPDAVTILEGAHHGELDSFEMHAKGQAVAAPYILAFIRHVWFDSTDEADLRLLRGEELADGVYDPSWWGYLDASVGGDPVIRVSHVDGCDADRLVIDDFARAPMAPISPSSENFAVMVTGDLSSVEVKPLASELRSHTYTSVLEVEWADGESGSVTWELGELDTGAATHLSFRVANVADIEANAVGACVVNSFYPALQFDAVLLDSALNSYPVPVVPTPQDYATVAWAQNTAIDICSGDNMMSEVIIPLGDACRVYPLESIRFEFGGTPGGGHLHIDNLELRVRAATPPCP